MASSFVVFNDVVQDFIDNNILDKNKLERDITRIEKTCNIIKNMLQKQLNSVDTNVSGNEFNNLFQYDTKIVDNKVVIKVIVNQPILNEYGLLGKEVNFGNQDEHEEYQNILFLINNVNLDTKNCRIYAY